MPAYEYGESLRVEAGADDVLIATQDPARAQERLRRCPSRGDPGHAARPGDDDSARTLVVTGAGGAFCTGADLTAEDRRPWPTRRSEPMFAWCVSQVYALTKQAVLRGLVREPRDSAMLEAWGQDRAFAGEDFREGIRAFRERRAPRFRGR